MSKKHTFTAMIQDVSAGGAFVEIPFDVEKAFGEKRPKVKATFEGVPYRGILSRMGTENHILIVLKNIREQIGKSAGDTIKVTVELDTEPRILELPKELIKELKKDKIAKTFFDTLSYSHQREYVLWINEAKKEETRLKTCYENN
ncbi:MAG: hypothetical protein UZ14_CFX002001240 [Chloroflexi bacterium OLB14]|nr:MAG: hypothetical protein UZ14_CFX002001240 [Chloroflexi bacterium OLB14]